MFLPKCQNIIRKTIYCTIEDFLHHGHLLRELNNTHIALIPKIENPKRVNDHRPISLYNVSYKFISKLLANRLWTVLPKIISPFQSAFISQRDIHDNLLIAHEILSTFSKKRTKVGYMAIKLDMKKAYDRIY